MGALPISFYSNEKCSLKKITIKNKKIELRQDPTSLFSPITHFLGEKILFIWIWGKILDLISIAENYYLEIKMKELKQISITLLRV